MHIIRCKNKIQRKLDFPLKSLYNEFLYTTVKLVRLGRRQSRNCFEPLSKCDFRGAITRALGNLPAADRHFPPLETTE
jgi:hypothetical protein